MYGSNPGEVEEVGRLLGGRRTCVGLIHVFVCTCVRNGGGTRGPIGVYLVCIFVFIYFIRGHQQLAVLCLTAELAAC